MITNKQYRRLMSEYEKTGKIMVSALKADVNPRTARKYVQAAQPPAHLQKPHTWRTRPDPLERIWPEVAARLRAAPEREAKTLFEHFLARPESGLEESHLRTIYRRVRHWRATEGPEQEVFFAQERQPGALLQLDWTYARELQITINGERLDHPFASAGGGVCGLFTPTKAFRQFAKLRRQAGEASQGLMDHDALGCRAARTGTAPRPFGRNALALDQENRPVGLGAMAGAIAFIEHRRGACGRKRSTRTV